MAELNESESTKDTKKTKKEKKMEEKAAKKAAKKAKKNHEADKPDAENDDSDSVSSKIVMVLVTILIIAIWLGIFAVFVKADVGGFGSTVLAPALKDVPVLSKILPDSGNITASESKETAGYTNLDDAVSRIKELEKQLDDANSKNQADAQTIIVAIASSTGGPKALQSVIPFLPAELLAPVVLVQHMPAGFTKSMAERLNELSQVQVKEASNGEVLKNGVVYIAPGGTHIAIKKSGASHVISFNDMPPISGLKPCANIMFDSLTSSNYDEVVCVVLTGMGADGTNGILSLGKSKPIYVIAQDEKSSVVYGMPRAIYEAGVVDEVVTLSDVAKAITKNVGVK